MIYWVMSLKIKDADRDTNIETLNLDTTLPKK